jgi:hypothetical protein
MMMAADRTRRYGPTAATLLAAYMLVLQGLAGGFAVTKLGATGLFGGSICFDKSDTPLDRSTPARPSRHSDSACCVFHAAGVGGASADGVFWDETPVRVGKTQARDLSSHVGVLSRQATLPVGSRAPPA